MKIIVKKVGPISPGGSAASIAPWQLATQAFRSRDMQTLTRLVPEFSPLSQSQNTYFHKFSMQDHTFGLLHNLGKIPDWIALAALFHDIAKPSCETLKAEADGSLRSQYLGHAEKSREIAAAVLARLQMPQNHPGLPKILALVEKHMHPVAITTMQAENALSDKALKKFIRDKILPLEAQGISQEVFLAFARADILASQGPQCYSIFGVEDGNYEALVAAVDKTFAALNSKITELSKPEPVAEKPAVTGADLIKAGFKPGPEFKNLLAQVNALVASGKSVAEALELVKGGQ